MNELRKKQLYLDAFIDTNHPVERNERIEFKVSWLLTEVAELANNDAWFKYCKKRDSLAYTRRYEEASDCLHLFISLANELGVEILEPKIREYKSEKEADFTYTDLRYRSECYKDTLNYITCISTSNTVYKNSMFLLRAFDSYLSLATSMGLKWEFIKKAYVDKNIKNLKLHVRDRLK